MTDLSKQAAVRGRVAGFKSVRMQLADIKRINNLETWKAASRHNRQVRRKFYENSSENVLKNKL
jgi:hypothetical protein